MNPSWDSFRFWSVQTVGKPTDTWRFSQSLPDRLQVRCTEIIYKIRPYKNVEMSIFLFQFHFLFRRYKNLSLNRPVVSKGKDSHSISIFCGCCCCCWWWWCYCCRFLTFLLRRNNFFLLLHVPGKWLVAHFRMFYGRETQYAAQAERRKCYIRSDRMWLLSSLNFQKKMLKRSQETVNRNHISARVTELAAQFDINVVRIRQNPLELIWRRRWMESLR